MDFDIFEEHLEIVPRIHAYLEGNDISYDEALANAAMMAFKRGFIRQLMEQREESKPGKLRCSNAGPCARKIAYSYLGVPPKGKTADARAKLTWLTGDVLEAIAVALVRMAGIEVESTCLDEEGQFDLYFDVGNGILVPGHPDGILPVQEGLPQRTLFEVKSTSDWAFKNNFKKGIIDPGYRLQHNVYLAALGLERGVFLAISKNTGELAEVWTTRDDDYVEWARRNYNTAVTAEVDNLPERYFDNDAYGLKRDKKQQVTDVICPLCGYCSWRDECWEDPQVEIDRYGKPVFRVHQGILDQYR